MEVGLRPVTLGDDALMRDVFASTRARELELLAVDDGARAALLEMQFAAQSNAYRAQFPAASVDVVLAGGEPAGRLYVNRGADAIHLVDIALLPAYRGRGLGTRLLTRLIEEARGSSRPVTLSVERGNPARRLYERLGFRVSDAGEVYLSMRYEPSRYVNTAS
jgi:ribosomal protein S18 acetylase RimI-like enzyme